jgi:capsular polysaccharide biosynthesis protein
VYQAESSLYIDPGSKDALQQSDGLLSPYFVREATSYRVMNRALTKLGWHGVSPDQLSRRVSAQALRGTNVMVIDAQASTPAEAADLANAVADSVVDQNRADAGGRENQTRQYLETELARLRDQLTAVQAQPAADPNRQAQLTLLQQQYDTTYNSLQSVVLDQARAADAIDVLERARPPRDPIAPKPALYLALAAAGGLVLGILIAAVMERLDDRLRQSEALGAVTSAPLLASVPTSDGVDMLSRTQAHLLARHPEAKVLMVAPVGSKDSAEYVARMLASASRRAGKKVQIVHVAAADGPRAADQKSRALVATSSRSENGTPNPDGHIVGVEEFRLDPARGWYDLAVVSVPPPHLDATAARVAGSVDVAVLVATAGRTRAGDARRAAAALRQSGVEVEAAILVDRGRQGRWPGGH